MNTSLKMGKKSHKDSRLMLFSVILFILLAVWLVISVKNAGSAAEKSRSESVYRTVMHSAALCYSIEGEYPPDLEYLEENYGIKINYDRYIVHYEYFGGNISPTVTVADRSRSGGEELVVFDE